MSNTFKAYIKANYTHNEMSEIAQHGCESGCASGLIYYSENIALFDQYRDDLFEIMSDWQAETGGDSTDLPDYVAKRTGTFTLFANAVVWFCAEIIAWELTQGAYIEDESESA